MEGTITITKAEYLELTCASEKLARLEGSGVDNWDFYGDALYPEGEQGFDEFCEAEKRRVGAM